MDMFPTILRSVGIYVDGEKTGLGVNLFSGERTLVEQNGYEYVNEELAKRSKKYDELFGLE